MPRKSNIPFKEKRDEARMLLEDHQDLYVACMIYQGRESTTWDQWMDLLGREYVDEYLDRSNT